MNYKCFIPLFIIVIASFFYVSCKSDSNDILKLNPKNYKLKVIRVDGKAYKIRMYEDLVYVKYPADSAYQKINIYVPNEYFLNQELKGYTSKTAPIFFPNEIGGYMPAKPGKLTISKDSISTIAYALSQGYIVASAGSRGRTMFYGKAPAALVDQKAAIRYLKFNKDVLPGNMNKIIANGTSAGGAIATLLGATGNSVDYAIDLDLLGAARTSDDIFAVSAYAPITNLDHADGAYEWQFNEVNSYKGIKIDKVNGLITRNPFTGVLNSNEIKISNDLKQFFPKYLNSLRLKSEDCDFFYLDENGNGNFKEYIKLFLTISARTAQLEGKDMSKYDFLLYSDGIINAIDFDKYVKYLERSKIPPAFDALNLSTPENELFGDNAVLKKHFTFYSYQYSTFQSLLASPSTIKQMNPMYYIGNKGAVNAKFWRLRHGTKDSETSLAISILLKVMLENNNLSVDFYFPWDRSHSGDYDLPELFEWIKNISSN